MSNLVTKEYAISTCKIGQGHACLACDYCPGCGQVFCGTCNTDSTMKPILFPGDSWPHPQSVS